MHRGAMREVGLKAVVQRLSGEVAGLGHRDHVYALPADEVELLGVEVAQPHHRQPCARYGRQLRHPAYRAAM